MRYVFSISHNGRHLFNVEWDEVNLEYNSTGPSVRELYDILHGSFPVVAGYLIRTFRYDTTCTDIVW